ncbi:hydrogenase maturation nickel metallochaperone HypA [Patescibacteria group bacterium]|nr:hydrogenase maturation nickel metallochaperone HypA [Patescibacteria group bacterium]
MHDLHLADKILRQIFQFAKTNNLQKIKSAYIKIGDIFEHGETISPENLKFNLMMLSKDTPVAGAEFFIEKTANIGEYEIVEIEGE